jgi:hypothetical protein
MPLRIIAVPAERDLLGLPWDVPLEDWPTDTLVALPRGISRHTVRFVRLSGHVFAVKEIAEHVAIGEYRMLRDLHRLDAPAVEAAGVISGREDANGEPLEACLMTRHLQFALPYRALFSQTLRRETTLRLVDALVALLVRLHLAGFYWGDCSLSNTLFRRDAGAFAAYLVDAETGAFHQTLSTGQREYDIDLARTNIFGELADLEAGELLDDTLDSLEVADLVVSRYRSLWSELTDVEEVDTRQMYRIDARIRRLNDLGFDVAELDIVTDVNGQSVRIEPKVVDPGHHSRRLLRLTGLDVEENQARRLLNDLDAFRAYTDQQNEDETIVAHEWLTQIFEPVVRAVPKSMRGKLEPAEVFHEVLLHRWYLSERAGYDIGISPAVRSYVDTVLPTKPDERAVLGRRPSRREQNTDGSGGSEVPPGEDPESTQELRLTLEDLSA